MQSEMITICLVEDHIMFRETLAHFLNLSENCRVTLQATNGKELQEILKNTVAPDILLLDIAMKEMDGFATIAWLHTAYPELPVIIVTDRETDLTMGKLIYSGARAILKKSIGIKELQKAIFRVKDEGYYFNDPASRNLLIAMYKEDNRAEVKPALTEKEWQFLKLAATGLTYGQIAAMLDVSERCVDKIRNRLFEKLAVQNRTMLAMKAIANGIAA